MLFLYLDITTLRYCQLFLLLRFFVIFAIFCFHLSVLITIIFVCLLITTLRPSKYQSKDVATLTEFYAEQSREYIDLHYPLTDKTCVHILENDTNRTCHPSINIFMTGNKKECCKISKQILVPFCLWHFLQFTYVLQKIRVKLSKIYNVFPLITFEHVELFSSMIIIWLTIEKGLY